MRTIRAPEVRQMMQEDPDALVISVLDGDVFRRSHIPESRNAPLSRDDFESVVESLAGYRERRLIVHDSSSESDASPEAAERLEGAGFTDVILFDGGLDEWRRNGYPLDRSENVATR